MLVYEPDEKYPNILTLKKYRVEGNAIYYGNKLEASTNECRHEKRQFRSTKI